MTSSHVSLFMVHTILIFKNRGYLHSGAVANHVFTLAKNIMVKTTQVVKITSKIPDKIVPSSSVLLNTIDTKGRRGGAPEGTAMQTSY